MKNNRRNRRNGLTRQVLAMLLVAVMLVGFMSGGVMATEGETEPTAEATVPETTAAAEETQATEPEGTTAPTQTQPEETKATEPEATTAPTQTQPEETKATEPEETTAPTEETKATEPTPTEPEKTAYDEIMETLAAMEAEAAKLEVTVEACDEFYLRLMDVWSLAYDKNEDGEISDEQLETIDVEAARMIAFLKDTYGYEYGNINLLYNPGSGSSIATATKAQSGIDFNLYDYDYKIMYKGNNPGYSRSMNASGKFLFINGGCSTKELEDAYWYSDITKPATEDVSFGSGRLRYEPKLWNGYPIVAYSSSTSTRFSGEALKKASNRSLAYLFGGYDYEYAENENKPLAKPASGITAYENIDNTPLTYNASTGYYSYSSATNAADFSDANGQHVYVRNYKEQTSATEGAYKANYPISDFMPFNSTLTNYTNTTNGSGARRVTSPNYWFGATMSATFYMPKGGVVKNQPMIYEFSGDDDVLVYIDDVLVLDLGGAHSRCTGTINFQTGFVEAYYDASGINAKTNSAYKDRYHSTTMYEAYKAAGYTTAQLNQMFEPVVVNGVHQTVKDAWGKTYAQYRLKDYTFHSYKWFYLERYGSNANFNVNFNLPTLPQNSITVNKTVSGYLAETDKDFTFKITLPDYTQVGYTKTTATGVESSGTLKLSNHVGTFKLKANEKIVFTGITYGKKYTIAEDEPTGYTSKLVSGTASGTMGDTPIVLNYDNTIKTYSAKVTKDVVSSVNDEKTFTFTAKLKDQNGNFVNFPTASNNKYTVSGQTATFVLGDNGSVTIGNLPYNTTLVVEEKADSNYTTTYKVNNGTSTTGNTASTGKITDNSQTIAFTNTLNNTTVSVNKLVSGNMGDREKNFAFTATMTDQNGNPINFESPTTGSYTVSGNTANFSLKHNGDAVKLEKIPVGAKIVISEVHEGYTPSATHDGASARVTVNGANATVTVTTDMEGETIVFTNDKEVTIDTGIAFDSMPYIVLLAGIAAIGLILFAPKRKIEE